MMSQESSVSRARGYGLDGRGSIPDRSKRLFSSPQSLDRLCGPPSFLSNGYRGLFPQAAGGVKLTTYLHITPRSRMVELYLHSPIRPHGVVVRDNFTFYNCLTDET
jgi:hypothetical protein